MGGTFGDVAVHPYARKIAHELIMECIRVGQAEGIHFAPIQGKDMVIKLIKEAELGKLTFTLANLTYFQLD